MTYSQSLAIVATIVIIIHLVFPGMYIHCVKQLILMSYTLTHTYTHIIIRTYSKHMDYCPVLYMYIKNTTIEYANIFPYKLNLYTWLWCIIILWYSYIVIDCVTQSDVDSEEKLLMSLVYGYIHSYICTLAQSKLLSYVLKSCKHPFIV